MINYSVYQVTPINESADGPVSIPEDVFLASAMVISIHFFPLLPLLVA